MPKELKHFFLLSRPEGLEHKTHSSIHDYNFNAFLDSDDSELKISLL